MRSNRNPPLLPPQPLTIGLIMLYNPMRDCAPCRANLPLLSSGPKGDEVLKNTRGLLFVRLFVRASPQALTGLKSALSGLESSFSGLEFALSGLKSALSGLKSALSGPLRP